VKRPIAFSVLAVVLVCAAVGQMTEKTGAKASGSSEAPAAPAVVPAVAPVRVLTDYLPQTGAKASASSSVEQALMQMERDWTDAMLKKDSKALNRILADDWVGQGPTDTTTKAQAVAELKSGDSKVESMTMGPMKVRVFKNTAVVTGSDDEKSSYKGKDTSGHWTWTDVFVKRNGRWQAAASQSTRM